MLPLSCGHTECSWRSRKRRHWHSTCALDQRCLPQHHLCNNTNMPLCIRSSTICRNWTPSCQISRYNWWPATTALPFKVPINASVHKVYFQCQLTGAVHVNMAVKWLVYKKHRLHTAICHSAPYTMAPTRRIQPSGLVHCSRTAWNSTVFRILSVIPKLILTLVKIISV